MHLDQFQRIMIDPASVSVIHYAGTRPFVLRMNTVGQDLESLIPRPAKKSASKKSASKKTGSTTKRSATRRAAVGGGLGTEDLL
jgi:hypothetical protein